MKIGYLIVFKGEVWQVELVDSIEIQDPIHYQNYTQVNTTVKQDKGASSAQVTSFSGSCLSMIEPLDNCTFLYLLLSSVPHS